MACHSPIGNDWAAVADSLQNCRSTQGMSNQQPGAFKFPGHICSCRYQILDMLGYLRESTEQSALQDLEAAVESYKSSHERLFPNWSEIFQVLLGLGYARPE